MKSTIALPRDRVHILIAEDSPTQAERLRHTLERRGYQVIATANGRQALDQARAHKPTLVISDIVMPEMDGYEFCRQLKSDPDLRHIPVILVTSLADPQDVIRGLKSGADSFVVKPYDEGYLLSRIDFVLLNDAISQPDTSGAGVEILFDGSWHMITADRSQILNLLLSTYEAAMQRNKELTATKDALRAANAALEASNKELETFSYSVSHDLRAPLRAIEGFSRILQEDCGENINAAGRQSLEHIQNAAIRMKQLIEDLLKLSRISRGDMEREHVNLSALAVSVTDELQRQEPDRQVRVQITPELFAEGDSRLLHVALENLLGNAWKFTSKGTDASIEFGMIVENGTSVFFVRDNGAGFDMAYANKLFGAFQRLHSTDEFPGTGIGLATVQRVLHRHGGRIWAQAAPGTGATFFFSL